MADFDDLIKSRLDEFRDTAAPSAAEIDRLNIGLDELTRPSWIARWWWLLLAFLLMFVGQGWLIYSNWSLRRQVSEITLQLNEDRQTTETGQEVFLKRSSIQSNASSDDVNSVAPIDSHAIALIYIEKHGVNSGILEDVVTQALIKIEKQLGQRYTSS